MANTAPMGGNGGIPSDFADTPLIGKRRLKTAIKSDIDIAYDDGRVFRAYYDFTSVAVPFVLKFEITKDIDLVSAIQEIHEGALRYRVFTGGVESGTFIAIDQFPTNNKTGVIGVGSGLTVSVGGALDVTGVEPNDIVYVRTSGASGQTATVASGVSSIRGFPPTTAYVIVDQVQGGNNPPKGVLRYEWVVAE